MGGGVEGEAGFKRGRFGCRGAEGAAWFRRGRAPNSSPLWFNIEATAVQGSSLCTLLSSKTESPCKIIGNNFILRNSLKILNQIRSICKLPNTSVHTPIFVPLLFVDWRERGLVALGDLYVDKHFASFGQLTV